ncbi:alpha/beta hydrolase family protein [Kaarinaea lacus]
MRTKLKIILLVDLLVMAAWLLSACQSDDDSYIDYLYNRGDLVSSTLLASHSKDDINALFANTDLFGPMPALYDVAAYKIIYKTVDTKGNIIDASGLLVIPQKAEGAKSPVLSYHHGTKFLDADVPSNSYGVAAEAVDAASFGYIVAAPDYIGYGVSKGIMHPHTIASAAGTVTIDMLRASKHFLMQQRIATNSQLFLVGHSEGGYTTIATQKMVQEKHSQEFTVIASTAGAGSYDISNTVAAFAQSATLPQPATAGFIVKAYDSVYELNRIDDIFQIQYVDIINTYYDGTNSRLEINEQLTVNTAELFNPQFLADFNSGAEVELKQKLAENDIYDWAPVAPTRFFHGQDDVNAPYFNSPTAVDTMKANGAPDVELVICQETPADHYTCRVPYFAYTIEFFAQYATDL